MAPSLVGGHAGSRQVRPAQSGSKGWQVASDRPQPVLLGASCIRRAQAGHWRRTDAQGALPATCWPSLRRTAPGQAHSHRLTVPSAAVFNSRGLSYGARSKRQLCSSGSVEPARMPEDLTPPGQVVQLGRGGVGGGACHLASAPASCKQADQGRIAVVSRCSKGALRQARSPPDRTPDTCCATGDLDKVSQVPAPSRVQTPALRSGAGLILPAGS